MLSAWSCGREPNVDLAIPVGRVVGCEQGMQLRGAARGTQVPGQVPQRIAIVDARGPRVRRERRQPGIQPAERAQVDVADAAVRGGCRLPELTGQGDQFITLATGGTGGPGRRLAIQELPEAGVVDLVPQQPARPQRARGGQQRAEDQVAPALDGRGVRPACQPGQ